MEPNPGFWADRPVCVTGGTGFLGYHIVRQLLALRARVRVFALPLTPDHPLQRECRVECLAGDIRDPEAVRRATAGCAVIFHTAGIVADWGPVLQQMHSVHVNGTRTVLETAPRDARIVHTSSIVAVGATRHPEPLSEDSPFGLNRLRVDYVHAKRAAEQVALGAGLLGQKVVVVNPGYLVGPEDHARSAMGHFCTRFWRGRLPVAPAGGLNLVDVRDVARGHLLAAEHGRPGQRYILGGENRSFHEFLALLAEVAGMRPRGIVPLSRWTMMALAGLSTWAAWMGGTAPFPSLQQARLSHYYWFCRSDRAVRELGYRSRPLADTLADTYRWWLAQGKLRLRGANQWWMRPGGRRAAAA
jgi:dihydroflavonol-4-reductase